MGELARGVVACALLLASGWGSVRAAPPPAADPPIAREYRAEITLDIDAQGEVAAIGLPTEVPPMLASPARDAIGHWRFKPPVREGRAMSARTYAQVALQLLRRADGNYGLRVLFRSNGPKLSFTRLPEYPRNEIRRLGQGKLVMEAIVHPDGTLSDLHMASYRFNHPNPGAFLKSAEAVMQQAQAQPELVDGKPVPTRIQVPFVYALQTISRSEALSRQARKDASAPADPDFDSIGQVVALDSPVQLIADPPG